MNSFSDITKRLGLNENGDVRSFLASRCAYYMDEFVPYGQGGTSKIHLRENITIEPSVITYRSIYAHYVFQGDVMGPNIPIKNKNGDVVGWFSPKGMPKNYTGAKMVYHPEGTKRGSYWHEKMKSAYMDTIVKEVQDYMKLRSAK